MSAAVAKVPRHVASPAAQSIRPTRAAPHIRKPLKRDERGLPVPHVNIVVRDTHASRLADHYYNTLRDDLMYMTYTHEPDRKPHRAVRPRFDPNDPYAKHRHNPPVGGNRAFATPPPPVTAENVIQLERIQLHTMVKEAFGSRTNLLPAIMAFRAISGESEHSGGQRTVEGVQIVKGGQNIGGWTRLGAPLGVKVDLKGPKMYDFLGMFVDCVLPRLRDFHGVAMPPPSQQLTLPHSGSGVVSIGLPPDAMAFFPQIEVNLDAYPRMYGMHIHFITNAFGAGAQNRARTLLSGFRVPFARV
ncbi:mitochondrial 50S ribosomal protein L5 [Fomitopsis serialis]|uniref:mitochondrial 50S ribosomal protein L5 n=1 Tax=Fomitopsis serialis TaxID=139415 RepID=UPI002007BA59|nr:mitochondrial 50S ribosomal protein L5 [Neoantrodia serialis]KAH9922947.1 mitochondrial 50S ribosomal protein L5 [Neoantrodia serialis]